MTRRFSNKPTASRLRGGPCQHLKASAAATTYHGADSEFDSHKRTDSDGADTISVSTGKGHVTKLIPKSKDLKPVKFGGLANKRYYEVIEKRIERTNSRSRKIKTVVVSFKGSMKGEGCIKEIVEEMMEVKGREGDWNDDAGEGETSQEARKGSKAMIVIEGGGGKGEEDGEVEKEAREGSDGDEEMKREVVKEAGGAIEETSLELLPGRGAEDEEPGMAKCVDLEEEDEEEEGKKAVSNRFGIDWDPHSCREYKGVNQTVFEETIAALEMEVETLKAQADVGPNGGGAVAPFRFLHLPTEVRVMVYERLLLVGKVFPSPHDDRDPRFLGWKSYEKPCTELFRVSQRLKAESEVIFYSKNHFVLPYSVVSWPGSCWYGSRGERNGIRSIGVAFDMRDLGEADYNADSWNTLSRMEYSYLHCRPTGTVTAFDELTPSQRREYIQDMQLEHQESAWADVLGILGNFGLEFLEIDLTRCFCPLGCHRMVGEVIGSFHGCRTGPSKVIQFVGLRSLAEKERIWQSLSKMTGPWKSEVRFVKLTRCYDGVTGEKYLVEEDAASFEAPKQRVACALKGQS